MQQKYLKNVSTLTLDPNACIGCGKCAEVCPHRVFAKDNGKLRIEDKDRCMECGACARNCPTNAVSVHAGVGCASAIIKSWFTGKEPSCECDDSGCC